VSSHLSAWCRYIQKNYGGFNAKFPIREWSVHDALLSGEPRDTNQSENYNRIISQRHTNGRPTMSQSVLMIRKEEKDVARKVAK
jgi:hypothetical protein